MRPAPLLVALLLALPLGSCAERGATASDALAVRGEYRYPLYEGAAMMVNHEAIPALEMPAMEMSLPVAEADLLEGLLPGDKVALTLDAEPRLQIVAVEKLAPDTPLALAP